MFIVYCLMLIEMCCIMAFCLQIPSPTVTWLMMSSGPSIGEVRLMWACL